MADDLMERGEVANRVKYRYDPASVLTQVLIIWPQNRSQQFVYCPPIGDDLPWTEEFADFDEATAFADGIASTINQKIVLLTRDRDPWWMNGLVPT